ncbi:hypothetical protein LCGC14_1341430 [marine sediment metagenome]|uniref:Uncharacterized protein n=1 Tax=marine sediment metagenome TaxID=412755 RepID=A0A0F9NFZ8_9ZZZZ
MKLTNREATAMKCLGGKLEIATLDPDPKALEDLTAEYNCKNCNDVKTCHKLYMAIS